MHAIVGASRRHNRIVSNISGILWNAARGGPGSVYSSNFKLRAADAIIYYPDVMVECNTEGGPLFEEEPCLVVEVTSPITETTDRREKLATYKRLPSLKASLIIAQDRMSV